MKELHRSALVLMTITVCGIFLILYTARRARPPHHVTITIDAECPLIDECPAPPDTPGELR